MTDKKETYQDGVFSAALDKKDALDPESVQPTKEVQRASTKKGAEEVGDQVASWLEENKKRLRIDEGAGSRLKERTRRARVSQHNVAAGERLLLMFKREERLRRGELSDELRGVYKQAKAQLETDPGLKDELASLFDYFGKK